MIKLLQILLLFPCHSNFSSLLCFNFPLWYSTHDEQIWFIFVPISTYMQIFENSLPLSIASQSSTFIWTLPICIVPIINIVVFLFAILQINKNVYKNFLHIQTFFLKFLLNSIWSCFVREFLYLNRILIWDEY